MAKITEYIEFFETYDYRKVNEKIREDNRWEVYKVLSAKITNGEKEEIKPIYLMGKKR